METRLSDEAPSVETLYVGQAMANAVLYKLLLSITTNLVHTAPEERETESADIIARSLADYVLAAEFDPDITDLPPGSFDREVAHTMALDALTEAVRDIRRLVLGLPE